MGNMTRYYFLQSTFNFKELAILVVSLPHHPNMDFEKPPIHRDVLAVKLLGLYFTKKSQDWIEVMELQLAFGLRA